MPVPEEHGWALPALRLRGGVGLPPPLIFSKCESAFRITIAATELIGSALAFDIVIIEATIDEIDAAVAIEMVAPATKTMYD
ncbi:hypothetical protein FHS20_003462 [Phyllobacterium endophyticum]|uniref:Uncharacterized protein n=1 Tax=Phyllobacterium endophyticum TaxID=1149773 RepID=A0A2P7ARP4_9HYPH|nr:hypothetical protein [Phyllobacterium endophyticum]PSH56888.1 hypothetical protein CU100_16400 [Phyllobacterium endophyticum]